MGRNGGGMIPKMIPNIRPIQKPNVEFFNVEFIMNTYLFTYLSMITMKMDIYLNLKNILNMKIFKHLFLK